MKSCPIVKSSNIEFLAAYLGYLVGSTFDLPKNKVEQMARELIAKNMCPFCGKEV